MKRVQHLPKATALPTKVHRALNKANLITATDHPTKELLAHNRTKAIVHHNKAVAPNRTKVINPPAIAQHRPRATTQGHKDSAHKVLVRKGNARRKTTRLVHAPNKVMASNVRPVANYRNQTQATKEHLHRLKPTTPSLITV